MSRTQRWLPLVLLVPLLVVAPARAGQQSTLTGTAGSSVAVTVRSELRVDWRVSDLRALTADRGPFVGFALVGEGAWLTYVNGRHAGRSCAFGARCEVDDWQNALGSPHTEDGGFVIPKGTYRLTLLAAPGARLTMRSTFPFLSGVRHTTRTGRVQLEALTSTTPPVGDAQPLADGGAQFEGSGVAITGLVWRLDAQYVDSAETDVCVGSGLQTVPWQTGVCEMGDSGVSEGSYVGYGTCSAITPTFLCLPVTDLPVSIAHGVAVVTRGGSHASYDMTVKAARSRVQGWAWVVRP